MKPTIAIIGAGSVVFTRELLGDILVVPRAGTASASCCTTSTPERLETAEAIAARDRRAAGATPRCVATPDRRRALDGADYVINTIQVGMHDATVRDFEVPARYGLRQTIADTIGVGGIFRGLRTFPVLAGIARDMAEVCPDAWLLNYTNPMAMNVAYLHRGRAAAEGARPVPLGVLDGARPVRAHRRAVRRGVLLVGRASTTRPGCCAGNAAGQNLYPLLDERIAADPSCAAGSASTCTAGSATTRPRPASTPASTSRGTCIDDAEIERLRIPVGDYVGISEENLAEYRPGPRRARCRPSTLEIDSSSTEYAPQVIHSLETGTARMISANVANDGPDHQPARRVRRRGADGARRARRAPDARSATCRRSARRSTAPSSDPAS